ncbi:exodeoxyribonuclease VII small subunit [Ostreiculturibacter nitratireducens]|uniref:exodeoxyribonuclease VII small subunit n=1 Tax=Ostreiculturibacter nitratireducens TaxID=3075226 RepID=UPI0031B57CBB
MSESDIGKMTFEEAMKELESVVGKLERGEVPLEESIALYERGAALKAHCEAKLKAAEERVEKITRAEGGKVSAEPVEGL